MNNKQQTIKIYHGMSCAYATLHVALMLFNLNLIMLFKLMLINFNVIM